MGKEGLFCTVTQAVNILAVPCGKCKRACQDSLAMRVKLLAACMNYSVTEIEMFGQLINIQSWKNELHNIEFDVAVNH